MIVYTFHLSTPRGRLVSVQGQQRLHRETLPQKQKEPPPHSMHSSDEGVSGAFYEGSAVCVTLLRLPWWHCCGNTSLAYQRFRMCMETSIPRHKMQVAG